MHETTSVVALAVRGAPALARNKQLANTKKQRATDDQRPTTALPLCYNRSRLYKPTSVMPIVTPCNSIVLIAGIKRTLYFRG